MKIGDIYSRESFGILFKITGIEIKNGEKIYSVVFLNHEENIYIGKTATRSEYNLRNHYKLEIAKTYKPHLPKFLL